MKLFICLATALLALPIAPLHAQSSQTEQADELSDAEIQRRWGAFALLPGSYWKWVIEGREEPTIRQYSWRERGRVLEQRSGINISLWEITPEGRLIRVVPTIGDTGEDWAVEDGDVVIRQVLPDATFLRTFRAESPNRIPVYAQKLGDDKIQLPEVIVRLNDPQSAPDAIQPGVFRTDDWETAVVITQAFNRLTIATPSGQVEYVREPDGSFRSTYEPHAIRILGEDILEQFVPGDPTLAPIAYVRSSSAGTQEQRLAYGYFEYADPRLKEDGSYVFSLEGDKLMAATPNAVFEYHEQPDGTFQYSDVNANVTYGLRIEDMYTVELFRLPRTSPARMIRKSDATPTYIADARRNAETRRREAEERQLAQLEAQVREAERAAREAEMDYEDEWAQENASTSTGANILQGFMKGWSEATASNQAMQQSMSDAANRGLADGAAEYARRQAQMAREQASQRRADIEHARRVREREEAARQARAAAGERARLAETQREQSQPVQARSPRSSDLRAAADGGDASTATDATICVQGPVVGPNPAFDGATLATLVNGCATSVDVRICLMGEGGWDCGVSYGVKPQETGSYWRSNSDGQVFWDARTSDSGRPLRSPN